NASLPGVDLCVAFVYPHWLQPLELRKPEREACRAAGKPFAVYEYGWDETNFPTRAELRSFLATVEDDPAMAGDAFWALQAHADDHGWMPIPANTADPAAARTEESGQWWALYYPGIQTLVSTAQDMAARAQLIRSHNYRLAGLAVPRHAIPPRPVVTKVA